MQNKYIEYSKEFDANLLEDEALDRWLGETGIINHCQAEEILFYLWEGELKKAQLLLNLNIRKAWEDYQDELTINT